MMPFALTLTPAQMGKLETFIQGLLILFAVVSFVRVGAYAAKKARAGQLFPETTSPPPLLIQPMSGWFFVISVVGLIYLQSALYALIVVVGTAGLLAENRRTATAQFGLDRVRPWRALTWSLVVFGAIILIEEPLVEVSSWALDALRLPHPEQQAVETFRSYNAVSDIFWFIIMAVVLSPIIEELFFRGFLLSFFRRYTTTWMAIILSAGVFAFAHLNLGIVLPLWFLGIVLGVAYQHTGSLVVPIGIHACFNLATALSVLLEKSNSS